MKMLSLMTLVLPLAVGAADLEESGDKVIPERFPASRYEASWSKNPFLLKTVPVTQPTVSFAQDWVISGMYNSAGKVVVSLMNRQSGERKRVTSADKEGGEFRLVKANFAKKPSDSSAEIAKGSEVATLKYDEQLLARPLSTPAPAPVAQAMNGRPGAALTPQQAQLQAQNGSRAIIPGGAQGGRAAQGGPIVVGQNPSAAPGQVATNNLAASGLPPGLIPGVGTPNAGGNNGINIDLTNGGTPTANPANPSITDPGAPATVTRRRRLIPAPTLSNP